jgi:hypothetical protein
MFPNGGAIAYATEQGQFGLFDVGSYACVSEVTLPSNSPTNAHYSSLLTRTLVSARRAASSATSHARAPAPVP